MAPRFCIGRAAVLREKRGLEASPSRATYQEREEHFPFGSKGFQKKSKIERAKCCKWKLLNIVNVLWVGLEMGPSAFAERSHKLSSSRGNALLPSSGWMIVYVLFRP
jgi:hypothetical protein